MAILEQKASGGGTGWDISEICPAGTQVAICLEIKDVFEVTRPKYDNPAEVEVVDLTRFLFGIKAADGCLYRVQTHEMKISSHEKSGLMKILTGWTAKPLAELMNWDYCEMQGQLAQLTVIHKTSKMGKVYPAIETVTPLHPQLAAAAPTLEHFMGEPVPAEGAPAEVAPSPAVAPEKVSHFGGEVVVQPAQPITTAENTSTIEASTEGDSAEPQNPPF